MAKRTENAERVPYTPRAAGSGSGGNSTLVLVGLGILLLMGGWSLAEVRSIKKDLGEKIASLDTKVAALQTKMDAAARNTQPPRRGPDPDKVYTIKTAGSPAKGHAGAVVTIAEFSDFQ